MFYVPVQIGTGAHTTSYTIGTVGFSGGERAGPWPRTPPPQLMPRLKMTENINLRPFCASYGTLRGDVHLAIHCRYNFENKYFTGNWHDLQYIQK